MEIRNIEPPKIKRYEVLLKDGSSKFIEAVGMQTEGNAVRLFGHFDNVAVFPLDAIQGVFEREQSD